MNKEEVFGFATLGVSLIVAGVALAWTGAANVAGRKWAWTAVSVSAIMLSVFLALIVVGLLITSILAPRGNLAYAWAALPFALASAGLLFIPRYYRRGHVRAFFKRARAVPSSYDEGRK